MHCGVVNPINYVVPKTRNGLIRKDRHPQIGSEIIPMLYVAFSFTHDTLITMIPWNIEMIYHTWSTHEILIITLKWSWSLIPMIPCGVIKHALLGIYYFIRWFSHDFGRWNLHFAWDFQASHLWWPPCSQMMFPSTSHCKHRIGHLKSLTFTNLMMISYYFIDIPFICPISHYEGRQIPAPCGLGHLHQRSFYLLYLLLRLLHKDLETGWDYPGAGFRNHSRAENWWEKAAKYLEIHKWSIFFVIIFSMKVTILWIYPNFQTDPIMRHWVYGKSHTKEC